MGNLSDEGYFRGDRRSGYRVRLRVLALCMT
jgi:hypothetical protein